MEKIHIIKTYGEDSQQFVWYNFIGAIKTLYQEIPPVFQILTDTQNTLLESHFNLFCLKHFSVKISTGSVR